GQRWFHLYPNEKITHSDVLHWTGLNQNWNHMCSECHSLQVKKGYDTKTDSYHTTWSAMNVDCESCHGQGSQHVAWVKEGKGTADPSKGLAVSLKPLRTDWTMDPATGNPKKMNPAPKTEAQLTTCARCHSRRSEISDDYAWGEPLLDTHLPALLEDSLYYPDGQIKEEVYEYGSFLQSKMFHEGVACSNCHDPHTQKLVAPRNLVCYQCHSQPKYDSPSHHFHKAGSAGASCVECHMPSRKYMIIDPRRDHSIRIPRPDLSVKLGVPNACNQCHTDKSATWAASNAEKWYGLSKRPRHYGEILHVARNFQEGSLNPLIQLAADVSQPSIVRATAIQEAARMLDPYVLSTYLALLQDKDPMIRASAVRALGGLETATKWNMAGALL